MKDITGSKRTERGQSQTLAEKSKRSFIDKALTYLDEEDIEAYVLKLHLHHADINFFDSSALPRIHEIFNTLIKDTKDHSDILKKIILICEKE